MVDSERAVIAGSERTTPAGATRQGVPDPADPTTVTLYLRRRSGAPDEESWAAPGAPRLSREEFAASLGADPNDVEAVRHWAAEHGLSVTAVDMSRRSVSLQGPIQAFEAALGTEMALYTHSDGTTYRGRTGPLRVARPLAPLIVAAVGLDTRPQASTSLRRPAAAGGISYTPLQLAEIYRFPTQFTGQGQTIGLIELGGGYRTADLQQYFTGLGLPTPTVTAVGVDGATNQPGGAADGEVMLDIEVVGAMAPGAHIAIYFAPNTDQGFIDAVSTAIHDAIRRPSVISISWGGSEDSWTAQSRTALAQTIADAAPLGVSVTAASGDNGSTDGATDGRQHVDFPASAPCALACGGTSLRVTGTTITSESVWNDGTGRGATGGGISDAFGVPSYQQKLKLPPSANAGAAPGRGVPDVSGNADPATGYRVRVDGKNEVVGGTSAVAPLWAALIARLNQGLTQPVGLAHPRLYALAPTAGSGSALRDITAGTNGAYRAGPGWDPCTGLGSPDGVALLASLTGTPAGSGPSAGAGGAAGAGGPAGAGGAGAGGAGGAGGAVAAGGAGVGAAAAGRAVGGPAGPAVLPVAQPSAGW